jgi:hypothetical protein
VHNSSFAASRRHGRDARAADLSRSGVPRCPATHSSLRKSPIADLCARCPAERWARRRGPAGEDVIEIRLGGERPALIELRKADGAYAVTGFGGWGLAIFEDLTALIAALAGRLRRRPPASLALPEAG